MNGSNGTHRRAKGTDEFRALPHNLNAEASVLGGIILDNARLAGLPELEVEAFYDHKHKTVFRAMRNIEVQGRPIDVTTLEIEIEKLGYLEAVGGVGFIGELCLRVPTADNTRAYADTVQQLYRNRKAILLLGEAYERAYNWQHDPSELVHETVGELQRIHVDGELATRAQRDRWTVPLADYLGDAEPDEDDSEDWIIRDVIPRMEPALWGGPMKGGKTWSALDLCICVALGLPWLGKFTNTIGQPARVLGLFLEDSKRRLRKRLWELARAHGTTPNDKTLREHLRISRAPLRLPDAKDQRRLTAEVKAWGAVLVVIDNLTRVMIGDPNSTREASAFTKAWTELGEETGASIVFLHHTRKNSGADRGATAVDPFDLIRGSGDFGATARNIIVTTPIRNESTEKLSEVRMRGNLDLRRESFALAFERKELLGRWQVKLVDRGELEDVKDEVRKDNKASKEEQKKKDLAAETERRRNRAVELARTKRYVTAVQLAADFGLSSPRSMAPILVGLVHSGVLQPAGGNKGYELFGAARREVIP